MTFKKIMSIIILLPIFIYSSDKIIKFDDDIEVSLEHPFLQKNIFKVIQLNNKAITGKDEDADYVIPGDKENFKFCINIFKNNSTQEKTLDQILRLYKLYNCIPNPKNMDMSDIDIRDRNANQYNFTNADENLIKEFEEEKNEVSGELSKILKKSSDEEIIKVYKSNSFPHGDNFLNSLVLFSLKNSGHYVQEYLLKNAIEIKKYTQVNQAIFMTRRTP